MSQSIIDYFRTGGFLMLPIVAVTFIVWLGYFSTLRTIRKGDMDISAELHFMGAMVAAAPLLGLLGTVIGIMDAFQASATAGACAASPLADGIGRALVTTQAGLASAIPGAFAIAHLRHLSKRHNA